MSRRLNPNPRGRTSQTTTNRGPQLKLTFGGKSGRKNGATEFTTLKRKFTKRKAANNFSDTDSTTSGDGAMDSEESEADEESDEADDESEDAEVDAPSRFTPFRTEAGPFLLPTEVDNGEWAGFPEADLPELPSGGGGMFDVQDFEKSLFESDDDQVYERVNEVSDSDSEDDEAIQRAETEALTAEFAEDLTSHFANQIDGMSAYGFGSDSEEGGSILMPFSSGDEANASQHRRVHFEEQDPVGIASAFAALADSPTMTRALLPSALPDDDDVVDNDAAAKEDDYDTDATEELEEPAKQWKCANPSRRASADDATPQPVTYKRGRGPMRGIFEDAGDKVTAILDPTGKKLLLSDPHLLGGVFARRFGPSAPASPSVGFSDAVFGESGSSLASDSPRPQSAHMANVDPIMAGLISGTNGHATGMPEAFMPSNSNFLNDLVAGDIFDAEEDDPETTLRLEDMIAFGEDTDDESTVDSPIVPNPFAAHSISAPGTPLAHLNQYNVAAFKRNMEPTYFQSSPAPLRNKFTTPLKRKRRNIRNDSPYNHSHYDGVTPVQRITAMDHEVSSSPAPSSVRMHKRRKTIL